MTDTLRPGTSYRFTCRQCGDSHLVGREDDWREIEEIGDCDQCLDREADDANAAYDREQTDTLGPASAREDVVLCARCARPTGRNILVKLCDACEHELDRAYQQWVEEQARIAYERSLLEAVSGAFWGKR